MKKKIIQIITYCTIIGFSSNSFADGTDCDIARDIEKKALKIFETDMGKGLKRFIKVNELCDSKEIKYNLGIAFYRYGNTIEAEKYLRQAVEKNSVNPIKLNNLASVILENNNNPKFALELAQRSHKLNKNFAPSIDTLAKAQFAAGKKLNALRTIINTAQKYGKKDYIKKTKQKIISDYTSYCLQLIKVGQIKTGLLNLKQADFESSIALTYCRILVRLGKSEKALQEISVYKNQFYADNSFINLYNEITERQINDFYTLFKSGQEKKAISLAKKFYKQNPNNNKAKKTYNKLLEAWLGDAEDIQIPVTKIAQNRYSTNLDIDTLLSSIGTDKTARMQDQTLTIDVELNIPKCKRKNKDAIALLIGNQRYKIEKRGLNDVKYAERDVKIMAKYLEKTMGYLKENILVKTNITSGDFRTLLGTKNDHKGVLYNYIRKGKSDVFIYYVGHGGPGPKGKSAYLVPVDAKVDYIQHNGYSLNLFYSVIERLPARNMIIVLDACFSGDSESGPLFKNISPAMVKTATPKKNILNAALFCATDKDQVATWYPEKRHSLFSYFFFKGLQGNADQNGDKIIRLNELKRYLKQEVSYYAQRKSNRIQQPLISGKNNFIIAEFK